MLGRICHGIERYMPLVILAVSVACLVFPACGLWIGSSAVSILLGAVMFCMGMHLRPADFRILFTHPRGILLGGLAQFTIMPLLGYALGKAFGLEPGLFAGVVLVGCCPGGTASNVITFLSKGDVALSVGMTTFNTLLAPVLTPLIAWLLLRTTVDVEPWGMLLSIGQVVILPITLGLLCGGYARRHPRLLETTPALSVLAITGIVACVVAHQADHLLHSGWLILLVVVLHNTGGFGAGFLLGRLLRLHPARVKALSVEIGMQNAGMATVLAQANFTQLALAPVPGAVFSIWHNFAGGMLASVLRRWRNDTAEKTETPQASAES